MLGTAIAAVAATAGIVIAADGDSPQAANSPSTTEVPLTAPTTITTANAPTTTTAPTATTAQSVAGPFDAFRLGFEGLGPIKLGMTLEEASRAGGAQLVLVNDANCDPVRNDSAMVTGYYRDEGAQLWFGISDGKIVSIFTKNPVFLTIAGIHVGDTRSDVLRAYPKAEDLPELSGGEIHVADAQGRTIIFYRPQQSVEAIGFIRLAASTAFVNTGSC
jgi:hypothetical protein